MRMQYSSKDEKNCVRCDNVIYRSEKRRTDGGMHSHFTCPAKLKANIMYMNKPDHKPGDERQILIVIDVDGINEFTSGWYDFNESEYYTHDGEMIEMSDMVAWDEKPTIEFIN